MTWKRPSPPCRFDGKRFLRRHGNEDRRPLHPLGLMHRRERDRVGRRVPDVGVRLRVVVGSLVLEPVRERLVLLRRLGVEVDRLEVRDRLAELPELVEDELTRAPGRPEPSPRARRAPRGTRGRGAGCCRRPTALPGRSRDPRPGRQAPPPSRRSRGEGSRPARELVDRRASTRPAM